jgi:HlyD family secretion protein
MKINIILALLMSFLMASCGKKDKVVKPQIKSLTEAVYASGNIFPKNEYMIYANADGLLNKLFVEAGDEVIQGQPLFKIDSDIQDARHKSSSAVYQSAVDNLSNNSPILAEAKSLIETSQSEWRMIL